MVAWTRRRRLTCAWLSTNTRHFSFPRCLAGASRANSTVETKAATLFILSGDLNRLTSRVYLTIVYRLITN
jgi:hypothetical protein